MPSKFTISQLRARQSSYDIIDTDLMLASIGTATYDLSSVRISAKEYGDYLTTTYTNNVFSVHGPASAAEGLSAVHATAKTINLQSLPTADTGLQTGDLFTQTKAQILGTGSDATKVLCVK